MNNELSRIHSLVDSDGTTHLADYTYLGRDRTVQVDFPQPGVKCTWLWQTGDNPTPPADPYTGWDRFGRAIDLRWIKNSSGAELERLQHGYDRASNRLYRKNLVAPDADKQDELYTYDGLSQLSVFQRGVLNTGRTAITGTPIAEEDFTFDPTGNWNEYVRKASGSTTLDQTRTHNKANELTAIDSSSSLVTEDAAGNMTKVPKPDSWSSAYDLKYDAWNRLVEVKDGSTVVAAYAYDGLNRRTKKVMGSTPRHFYYTDKWQIIEERVNASTSADRQFVWGIRYTDDLVLRDKGTERLYVIQDYFQPTAVMDTTGAVLERYGYEAFGKSRVMTPSYVARDPSDYEWETRFGAYRWDGETQMLQVRNRYLHTQLGRWVTRDLIEYGDGVNIYVYAGNNSIVRVDSSGLIGMGEYRMHCCGQIWNPKTHCCGGGVIYEIGELLDTGVTEFRWDENPGKPGKYHVWLDWDGLALDSNGDSVLLSPGNRKVVFPQKITPVGGVPTKIKKSPCEYDFSKFKSCLFDRGTADNGSVGGYCSDYAKKVKSECLNNSKR